MRLRAHPTVARVPTRVARAEMVPQAATPHTALSARSLHDAHCHPQVEGERSLQLLPDVQAGGLAVMATRRDDWPLVAQLHEQSPQRVVPCFGVHPWHAHLHALGGEAEALLEGKSEADVAAAAAALRERGDIALPRERWEPELRRLLTLYPTAIVGEFGLDRAAVVMDVGVRGVMPGYQHQLALTTHHLRVAAEMHRAVSMHCVRCYGHLLELFRQMDAAQCPPRVMLHSYGGSTDTLRAFLKLPTVGGRFYFSFSHVINANKEKHTPAKLLERLRAVPDDRLLLESDQGSALDIDPGLHAICELVAQAKGWSLSHTAAVTRDNFSRFYADSLHDHHLSRPT